jgi:hypothetical protein
MDSIATASFPCIGGKPALLFLQCTKNAIAPKNYLKRNAPQKLMLRTQVFTTTMFKAQRTQQQLKKKIITIIEK